MLERLEDPSTISSRPPFPSIPNLIVDLNGKQSDIGNRLLFQGLAPYNYYAVYNQSGKVPPLCSRDVFGNMIPVSRPTSVSSNGGSSSTTSFPSDFPVPAAATATATARLSGKKNESDSRPFITDDEATANLVTATIIEAAKSAKKSKKPVLRARSSTGSSIKIAQAHNSNDSATKAQGDQCHEQQNEEDKEDAKNPTSKWFSRFK